MTSYLEQMQTDPALRAFVQAEIARAVVDLAAFRVEHERDQQIIQAQKQEIGELRALLDMKEKSRRK